MSHSENFIAHTTVQEVFDVIWFGEKCLKVNQIELWNDLLSDRSKGKYSIECLRQHSHRSVKHPLEYCINVSLNRRRWNDFLFI